MTMILKKIANGICAGILIAIGGTIFLKCVGDGQKYVGALLFSIALLTICFKGYSLYTGKIGYIAEKHGKEEFSVLLLGLLGNAIATIAIGIGLQYAMPELEDIAFSICSSKLDQTILSAFVRAIFCGILMYIAVSLFNENNKNPLGIIFAIPVFILSGFEHSIADMFYFSTSGIVSWQAFGYLWLIILGNSVGAVILPLLKMIGNSKKAS